MLGKLTCARWSLQWQRGTEHPHHCESLVGQGCPRSTTRGGVRPRSHRLDLAWVTKMTETLPWPSFQVWWKHIFHQQRRSVRNAGRLGQRRRASKRASREKVHRRRPELTGQGHKVERTFWWRAGAQQHLPHRVLREATDPPGSTEQGRETCLLVGRDGEGSGATPTGCMTPQDVICYSYLVLRPSP